MDTLSAIHVGNGALLENTINLCRKAFGDCEFLIITGDVETNKQRYTNLYNPMFGRFWIGLGKTGKIFWALKQSFFMLLHIINENTLKITSEKITFNDDQKNAFRVIEQADICVSCGGEVIGDTYFQALPFWLFTYWIAIKKGKKFILFPQSVGPLKMLWTRILVRLAIKNASLLAGRDKPSYETLLSLGFEKEKVLFAPDVAIWQETGTADITHYFTDKQKKIIGVTISNPPFREMGVTADFVQIIGEQLEKFDPAIYKILIMPSNYILNGISEDYDICLKLKDRLSNTFDTSILENRPYFPDEYIALLSQLELFITTRMHVAILSTTAFIPTIAINTQHKIRGYMQNIDMNQFCLEYSELDNVYKLANEIISERNIIIANLKTANNKLKSEHELFIQKLKKLYNDK